MENEIAKATREIEAELQKGTRTYLPYPTWVPLS